MKEFLKSNFHILCVIRAADDFESDEPEIDSILRDDLEEDESEREPKFMLYWTTIVKTSYVTKYTSPSTIATVMCTPSGFALYSACGKKK